MVLKSEIELSVEQQKQQLSDKQLGQLRLILDTLKLDDPYVLIITGIRRCGKSTLLHQMMARVNVNYGYFNFEDPRTFGFDINDFPKLNEILAGVNHFYFDEIQNVDNWEVYVRSLHDQGHRIVITGSNASLLSKELGTRLTGRHKQIELFPFSYTEFCNFCKLEFTSDSFSQYLDKGGFPEYLQRDDITSLQQLFKDIIYRDIIVRYNIRNSRLVEEIALFLLSNIGKEFSLTKIRNSFGVGSTNSVADYVSWFEDSYLLFTLPRFSYSLKAVSVNPKKVYTIDSGFAKANSLSYTEDHGRLLENMVYIHLRRHYQQLYYFKEKGECDFVVLEGQKVLHLIQVCYRLTSDNLFRELKGLEEALTFFGLNHGVIVTLDQDDHFKLDDGRSVTAVPAHQWFSTFPGAKR